MDAGVRAYIDGIDTENRPLFDRIHGLVLSTFPDAEISLSYGMPTYRMGARRLHVGTWKHGVSMYGWGQDAAAGFLERHPQLKTSKGTIRLRPAEAERVSDDDLRELIRTAMAG